MVVLKKNKKTNPVTYLDFKSELSGGFRVKHTVRPQSSSLVQREGILLIS